MQGGNEMSVYIIAEAGVNHNGSFDLACRLVDAAKTAGVDCIKFQTFKSKNLVSHKNVNVRATLRGNNTKKLKSIEAMGIDVSFNGNLFEAIAKSETEREIVRINPAYDRRQ